MATTLLPFVAAVRQGCFPSYLPTVTRRGKIFWFSFNVKIGTSILSKIGAARPVQVASFLFQSGSGLTDTLTQPHPLTSDYRMYHTNI